MDETRKQTTEVDADLKKSYETKTCGRCGGSGHYSYCQMYGTTCFGCRGAGKVYTKRGLAAIEYARKLSTMKTKDVQLGMLLFVDASPLGGKSGWFTVAKSELTNQFCTSTVNGGEPTRHQYWNLETSQGSIYTFADSDVQCVQNKEQLVEFKAMALTYQSTLLKTGKQSKRLAKLEAPEMEPRQSISF